jgi:uncharacterized damage-inducible protein DinB
MSDFLIEISRVFDRDIQKSIDEIALYKNEKDIWLLPSGINNSAGTLALHLAGNLQHFIGTVLGQTDYIRNRPEEFEARDVSKADLISALNKAKTYVRETLKNLSPEDATKDYPEPFIGETVSNYYILVHLAGHLNYHLGQINYHRRLLTD